MFDGGGSTQLLVPDLISASSLKEGSNGDLSFDDTWAISDYWLLPYNSAPLQHWCGSYTAVKARTNGAKAEGFTACEQNIQITGIWGYLQYREDSGTDLNDASMTTTKITVAVDDGTQFQVGQTVLMRPSRCS